MKIRRIRIRMPRWQEIRSANWAKELLMTFIGTTMSIILTFGTAHFVEEKQNREDGRQIAMMVIHDIENAAEIFRSYAKEDEKLFNTSQYVREHLQHIDSIPEDSLRLFIEYVAKSIAEDYSYDDSSERTFLSSPEAWKNINNAAFIDAVQSFYHYRRTVYSTMREDWLYMKPISNNEFYQLLLEQGEKDTFYQDYASQLWKRKDVDWYVSYSYYRRSQFNHHADVFRMTANRCKFMMNISDNELAQYVQERERTGKPLSEKKLIGKWEIQTSDDHHVIREYKNDHSCHTSYIRELPYSCYTGLLLLKYTVNSTWQLRGDSILVEQLPDYTFEIDRSQIHYAPDKAEEVERILKEVEQSYTKWFERRKTQSEPRQSQFASIDASGNKIELRGSDGRIIYLTRSDKP